MTDVRPVRLFIVLATALVLLLAAIAVVVTWTTPGRTAERAGPPATTTPRAFRGPGPGTAATAATAPAARRPAPASPPPPTTAPTSPPLATTAALGPVALTGCPPSTKPPAPTAPGHPSVLVPESALPAVPAPSARVSNLSVISGKGMWIWEIGDTSGGNLSAIVTQAVAAGLRQVWIRVGSSLDGFYGQGYLNTLVPALHARGIAVIGWGFPYLYDPVGDVVWTNEALTWRSTSGERLDGWGADIETASEGTALSAKRASTYLGLVRPDMGGRPLIAIVYPPTSYWTAHYPYQAMAPYIDAFAPMMYWSCVEPGAYAALALKQLSGLAPVHLIGQAYDMGPYGGRDGSPSGAEIARFLDVARRGGAVGGSFWVWQDTTAAEWAALTSYRWPA